MAARLQSTISLNCLLLISAQGEARAEDIRELFDLDFAEVLETLNDLERDYIIISKVVNNNTYYSFNPLWSYADEIKSMLEKITSCMPLEDREKLLSSKNQSDASN